MNKSSRAISLILLQLDRLESDRNFSAIEAAGLVDEIRRLQRKWDEQIAAGSPRRIARDFAEMKGWYRRWLLAVARFGNGDPLLQKAKRDVEEAMGKL